MTMHPTSHPHPRTTMASTPPTARPIPRTGRHPLLGALLLVAATLPPAGPSHDALAQSKVGTTAAPFLTIGTGARGSALGHAYTAHATGADALFWNVSGSAIPDPEAADARGSILFTNFRLFAGIDYNAIGLVLPVSEKGVLGLSAAGIDYGSMPVRTGLLPEGTGERFSASDLSLGLSYAMPLSESFYIGGQAKWVSQRIWDMKASTLALDLGLTLITPYLNGMRLSASIQNFGGRMRLDGVNVQDTYEPNPAVGGNDRVFVRRELDSYNIPLSFKFGLSVPVVETRFTSLYLLGESHQTNDQNLNADLGSEFVFKTNSTRFSLRGGYRDLFLGDQVDSHWSYGAGLDVALSRVRVGFDFAVARHEYLDQVQMIDFRVWF